MKTKGVRRSWSQVNLLLFLLLVFSNILFGASESEPNNSCGEANLLLDTAKAYDSGVMNATIPNATDYDWFKVVLTQEAEIEFRKKSLNDKAFYIKLFKSDCSTYAGWYNRGRNSTKKIKLEAGTYYIKAWRRKKDDVKYTLQAKLTKLTNLKITKTADKANANPGDEITFTIVAENEGPTGCRTIIKDSLPTGLTFKSQSGCEQDGNGIECKKWINAGASKTITLKATVDANANGTITNISTITKDSNDRTASRTFDTNIADNTSTASITVGSSSGGGGSTGGCLNIDNDAQNSTSPGVAIPGLDGTTADTTVCISGSSENDNPDYYNFTVATDGILKITTSSPNNQDFHLEIWKNGNSVYGDSVAQNHVIPTIQLKAGDKIVVKFKESGWNLDEYQATFDFKAIEIVENADDLCYEDIQYSGMFCMDMGFCKGGMGCRTTFPLKNISSSNLDDVEVIYKEDGMSGSFGDSCGVEPDGTCDTGHGIDMGPMGFFGSATVFDFTNAIPPSNSNEEIWAENFMSGVCFSQDNLYATYIKDGKLHRGKLKKCGSLPDEEIPTADANATAPICGVFEDMFQTREQCNSTGGGEITFDNAGQTLDNSNNVIIDAADNTLVTCNLTAPQWVTDQFETCGDKGDCIATGTNAEKLDINYDNPPAQASITDKPAPDTAENVILEGEKTLTGVTYNEITTSWHTNTKTTFSINTTLKINSLKLTNDNVVKFESGNPYSLDIGEIGIENNGANNEITAVETAKNIKIKKFKLLGGTKLNFATTQTIQMEEFEVGRGNSDINLTAPYIKINKFTFSNANGENAKIYLKADYIDIGELNFGQGATLIVKPYTPGKRVLFRSNSIKATSSSTMIVDSGNYYTKVFDIPGTSDAATIVASDPQQTINLFINGDFKPGNNPGINSIGNNGKFGNNPPVNFLMFINGDLETGGGGTTFNATIYVEGNVNIGNPTYIKGAVSANSKIDVGQGQFFYDQNLYNSDWGPCRNCIYVQWQKDLYSISEDFQNPMPPKKTLYTTIELARPVNYDVTVHYKTIDGTAKAGDDYVAKDTTATIKAGDKNVTVPIEIYNDAPIELDENFFIQLYSPSPSSKICLNEHNKTQVVIKEQTDVPTCFEDNFDNGLDSRWRVLKSDGGFTPKVVKVNGDYRLRITPGEHNIATAITKDYKFNTKQNLIIVEFDYYAYGGCGATHGGIGTDGADGIVNVLFDSDVGDSPEPGGYGGSMGYAQMVGDRPGFEGGWLGLGIDEYGNFGNCNERRVGGLPNTSCDNGRAFNPQTHRNTAVIRGDLNNNDRQQGYEFLAGVELTKPPLNQPKVAQKSGYDQDGYYSGRYKMTVDARDPNHLYIRLERKLNKDDNYTVIIKQFDAKDPKYNQGATPEFVRYAITGGTGGGCNNHEISWIKLRGNCQVYNVSGNFITGPFTAIDDFRWNSSANSLMDAKDQAISTKDANKTFKIVIASLSEDGFAGERKPNIDIKYALYSGSGLQLKTLSDVRDFNATNEIYKIDTFSTNDAYSDAHIRIFYCGERNSTNQKIYLYPLKECGITDNNQTKLIQDSVPEGTGTDTKLLYYHESDHFAIKPSAFKIEGISSNSTYKAGEDFNITFKAINGSNEPTSRFNEVVKGTFLVDINDSKWSNGCRVAKFDKPLREGWGFKDGQQTVSTKYLEVGNIYIKIFDTNLSCQQRFAHIDCKDKNISGKWNSDTDTAIGEDKVENITFLPDHFDINGSLKDAHIASTSSADMNYTYLSDDLNMSSVLSFDITAQNRDGNATTNYNKDCYAKDLTTLDIGYMINSQPAASSSASNPNPGGVDKIKFLLKDDSTFTQQGSQNLGSKVSLGSIPASVFNTDHNGTAKFTLNLNFDRKMNKPVQPFKLQITDANVTDSDSIKDKDSNITGEATYLYARVKSSQKLYDDVTSSSVKTPISIVIYSLPAGGVTLNSSLFTPTNEYDWFLNTLHNPVSDGTVYLTTTNSTQATVTHTPSFSNGIDIGVTVTAKSSTRPLKVDVNLTGTDKWLIYNPDSNSEPVPFYRVMFIGGSGWAGHGETGRVVDTNSSSQKTKRLEW